MTITVEATYEDGVLKPAQPLALAEHEKVLVTVEPQGPMAGSFEKTANAEPSLAALAEQIVARAHSLPPGSLDALPDDLAAEHDHYLYGTPKRYE
jgi:predicted DNA-binding antitoxin AbrB/MazE fold protein